MRNTLIPGQTHGNSTEAFHGVSTQSKKEAQELFTIARSKLLDVNNWYEISGQKSAKSTLCDRLGNMVTRMSIVSDYIRFELQGPKPKAGEGYDWVIL